MSQSAKLSKYGKIFGAYSIGIFLNQGINLLMIPVLWQSLTPEDFGIIAISQLVTLFLSPVYMLGASEAIQRFYYDWKEEARPHYVSWFFWALTLYTLVLSVVLHIFGSHYSGYLIQKVPFDPYLRYTIWSAFFSNFIYFPITLSRIRQDVKHYNLAVNGSFLTQIAFVLYFVKVQNLGAEGYLRGFLIAQMIWCLPLIWITAKHSILFPSLHFFQIPLRYSLPLSVSGVVEGLYAVVDRYFLDKFVPLSTAGFYNLGRQFGSLINIINSVAKLIFIPYIYKINSLQKENAARIVGEAGLVYAALMTIPLLAVCSLSHELVTVLNPSEVYLQIIPFIPFFAVSYYFLSLTTVMGRGMDLAGVSKWSFVVPLSGIVVGTIVYVSLLPESGVRGVLYGMLAGSLCRNVLNIYLANRFFPRPFYFKELAQVWLLALGVYMATLYVPHDSLLLSLTLKGLFIFVCLGIQIEYILKPYLKRLLGHKDA